MPIRVLLVEDSPVALTILKRIFDSTPDIEIVGTAHTGLDALALIPKIHPDVICTDFHMPQMNGLEFTSHVMTHFPLPILVISASVQEDDTHRIFQLLEAGAVDILPKPKAGLDIENTLLKQALINKVRVLSGVKVFKKKRSSLSINQPLNKQSRQTASLLPGRCNPKIVVVGASTGGPLALQEFLTHLPADFPLPIICVQHISLGFLQSLIDWLATSCQLPIQIAQAGERPKGGQVYFPSERQHLELDRRGKFVHSLDPPLDGHRPSVTTTFISVAEFYGRKTIGVLLTGMGRDGAEGMKEIAHAGGMTIAQDEATCVVFGMPKEAIALGAADQVLPIQAIAPAVLKLVQSHSADFGNSPLFYRYGSN
ncbi:MAG: chemotaxis-specific protein-glutamate methyltransferase CheB [Leptolyngbya sp. SIO1D8]|nr:chemotaxis-specific protein-glutamate methyltransferase CheB [Leptolyngbya sp. SIO1D8]